MATPIPSAPIAQEINAPVPAQQTSTFSYLSPLTDLVEQLASTRDRLNLPDPGKCEDLGREVKATHLTNYIFDGARADLSKTFSQIPAFQVTHSFTAGSTVQGPMGPSPSPGTYNFGAVYATDATFLQGSMDNEGGVTGRLNHGWTPKEITKLSMQLSGKGTSPSMFSVEHDKVGRDFAFNAKVYNPSPLDGFTGTYVGTYLQSITPRLALGLEALYQRPTPDIEDCSLGYMLKWSDVRRETNPANGLVPVGTPLAGSTVATAQILPQGIWQATYWKKLSHQVEAGVDLMVMPAVTPKDRKAIATAGVKYDFRTSSFRAQVDSTGKVSTLLEQRLNPAFAFLVAGEMDHASNTSKFGVGVMIESADEAVMEAANAAQAAGITPAAPPV